MKVLIAGFGSIGQKHSIILKKIKNIKITIYTKQKKIPFPTINNFEDIKKLNPDYFVVALPTPKHFTFLKFIESNFSNKKVLIEKPLFEKFRNIRLNKNKYWVGYNLRFHPLINFLKKKKLRPININIWCSSYLPFWRKNINYKYSNSADKKGGGVLLELSHEIDYLHWLFGEFKILFSLNKKISNLKIKSNDLLIACLRSNKYNCIVNINLNFFSRNLRRGMSIDTNAESYYVDLIKNKIEIFNGDKKKVIKYKNFKINKTYYDQHLSIINDKTKHNCTFTEGLKLLNFLKKIS
tara:strand:+ start:456 stop:1340 length:885 start_codon:yes stop_codon:yes gene_type:complete